MPKECCEKCGTKKFNYGVKDYRPQEHCENPNCECHDEASEKIDIFENEPDTDEMHPEFND